MTTVLPDLDAETVEELRPPCDVRHWPDEARCSMQAEWVTYLRCDDCGWVHQCLQCDAHKAYFVDCHRGARCRRCHVNPMPYTCLSVERL